MESLSEAVYVLGFMCFTACLFGWIGWIVLLHKGRGEFLQNLMRERAQ